MLKTRIRRAQVRAVLAVNRELVLLYWSIGRDILSRQGSEGWGTKVIDRLAHDLQVEFPGIVGFSPRSLKCMRYFAAAITWFSSTGRMTSRPVCGISTPPLNTAGAATSMSS